MVWVIFKNKLCNQVVVLEAGMGIFKKKDSVQKSGISISDMVVLDNHLLFNSKTEITKFQMNIVDNVVEIPVNKHGHKYVLDLREILETVKQKGTFNIYGLVNDKVSTLVLEKGNLETEIFLKVDLTSTLVNKATIKISQNGSVALQVTSVVENNAQTAVFNTQAIDVKKIDGESIYFGIFNEIAIHSLSDNSFEIIRLRDGQLFLEDLKQKLVNRNTPEGYYEFGFFNEDNEFILFEKSKLKFPSIKQIAVVGEYDNQKSYEVIVATWGKSIGVKVENLRTTIQITDEIEVSNDEIRINGAFNSILSVDLVNRKTLQDIELPFEKIQNGIQIDFSKLTELQENGRYNLYVRTSDGVDYRIQNPQKKKLSNYLSSEEVKLENGRHLSIMYTYTGRLIVDISSTPLAIRTSDSKLSDLVSVTKVISDETATRFTLNSMLPIEDAIIFDGINFQTANEINDNYLVFDLKNILKRTKYTLYIKVQGNNNYSVVSNNVDDNKRDHVIYVLKNMEVFSFEKAEELNLTTIVTFYNVEDYLEELLESLTHQGLALTEHEILMINDGSNDRSREIAVAYQDQYDNFRLIDQENAGLGEARNTGLANAKGKYINFADGDDIIIENGYREMLDRVLKTGSDIITGGVKQYKNGKEIISGVYRKIFTHEIKQTSLAETPILVYDTTAWNKLYKRSWFTALGFHFPTMLYEDIPVTVPAFSKANSIDVYPGTVYLWRIRSNPNKPSITQRRTEISNWNDRLVAIQAALEGTKSNPVALLEYQTKVLTMDYPMYIKLQQKLSGEYKRSLQSTAKWFLETFDKQAINQMSYLDTLRLHLASQGDWRSLTELENDLKNDVFYPEIIDGTVVTSQYSKVAHLEDYHLKPGDITGWLSVISAERHDDKLIQLTVESNISVNGRLEHTFQDMSVALTVNNQIIAEGQLIAETIEDIKTKLIFYVTPEAITRALGESDTQLVSVQVRVAGVEANLEIVNRYRAAFDRQTIRQNGHRIGLGETTNFALIAFDYVTTTNIEKLNVNNHELIVTLDNPVSGLILHNMDNNNEYQFGKISDTQFSLAIYKVKFNSPATKQFRLEEINSTKEIGISTSIGNTYSEYNYQAISVVTNNLGQTVIDFDYRPVLVSEFLEAENTVDLVVLVPESVIRMVFEDSDVILRQLNVQIQDGQTIEAVLPVGNIEQLNHQYQATIRIPKSLNFTGNETKELNFVVYDGVFNKVWNSIVRLGRQTPMQLENTTFKFVADTTRKNHPLFIQAQVHSFENISDSILHEWKKKYRDSNTKKQTNNYAYFRQFLPIEDDVILYESFFGSGMTDNPYAVFKHILENDLEQKYLHVWAVKSLKLTPQMARYIAYPNVVFVQHNSDAYRHFLAVAKHIIVNTSMMSYFARREGQRVIQLWHGVPLKALGRDMKTTRGANRNVIRSLAQATTFLNPNLYTETKVMDTLDLKDIQNVNRVIAAYPRWERVLNAKQENYLLDVLAKEVPIDTTKKIALYAPTWRGDNKQVKNATADFIKQYQLIKENLPADYQLVLKVHANAYKDLIRSGVDVGLFIPEYLDAAEILSVTDVLISDYSSIMFDFYLTKKPVISWMYDKDEYVSEQGFYPEIFSEMPWIADNERQLVYYLNHLDEYEANDSSFISDHIDMNHVQNLLFTDEFKTEATKVDVQLVSTDQFRKNTSKILEEITRVNQHPLVLMHYGDYSQADNLLFSKLPDDTRNFYRVGPIVSSEAEFLLLMKYVSGYSINDQELSVLQQLKEIEIQRSLGNINVSKVSALDKVSADYWISKLLIL